MDGSLSDVSVLFPSLLDIDYFWNDPQSKQIITRGVRVTSHTILPSSQQQTKFVHQLSRDCYIKNIPRAKVNAIDNKKTS
jgi:hypothetical protein